MASGYRRRSQSRRRRKVRKVKELLNKTSSKREINRIFKAFLYIIYRLHSALMYIYKCFDGPINFVAGLAIVTVDFLLFAVLFVMHFLWLCIVSAFLAIVQLACKKTAPTPGATAETVRGKDKGPGTRKPTAKTGRGKDKGPETRKSTTDSRRPAEEQVSPPPPPPPPSGEEKLTQRSEAGQTPPAKAALDVSAPLKRIYGMVQERMNRGKEGEAEGCKAPSARGSRTSSRASVNASAGPDLKEVSNAIVNMVLSKVVSQSTGTPAEEAAKQSRGQPTPGPSGQNRSGPPGSGTEEEGDEPTVIRKLSAKVSDFLVTVEQTLDEFREQDKAATVDNGVERTTSDDGKASSEGSSSSDEKEEGSGPE